MPKNYLTRVAPHGGVVTLVSVNGSTREPLRVDVNSPDELIELWMAVTAAIGQRGGTVLREVSPAALEFAALCAASLR
jgi:hypothetical protein